MHNRIRGKKDEKRITESMKSHPPSRPSTLTIQFQFDADAR